MANIAGAATTEALAGSTGAVVSPFVGTNQTASQRRFIKDSALGNEAAMQQAAGTQGIASFAVAPANQTAVSTQPEAMTTSPTVFNPNLSETAGELAQSNVPTSYDIEQDRVAGLLEGPQALDSSASSLDVIAAQQVIEDQIQQTGTVSPQTLTDLQAATGLSENDLNSIAVNAALGISSDQAVPTSAIQMFNQAAAPSTDPSIDTAAPSLPTFNVAGAPGQPVLPAGVDTSPIISTRSTTPDIPRIDVAGLGSLQTDFVPNIDTASFQQGTDDTTAEVQLPAATDGDTLPAATGTEVIIDDDGSARQVGGLEGEILGPEISTEVNPEEDTGVTIDVDAVSITPGQSNIPNVTAATDTDSNIPNVTRTTTTDTAVDQNIKPLIEVDVDEPPEPPEEVDPEEPVVVEIDDDDTFVPPVTKTDDKGNIITECPEGYMEVQTPDGIICEKITTATTTTGRRTYGVGRTATTGLAGNIGRQIPRSRTRTTTTTSRSRVKPTTRSA